MSASTPTNPIARNTLIWSAIVIGALAVIGAIIGWAVDGGRGLLSALIAVLVAGLFLGLTALLLLVAGRTPQGSQTFFVIF
ncbi:MAG: hypothetical protein QM607_10220, partial [Microbacterium sp.]